MRPRWIVLLPFLLLAPLPSPGAEAVFSSDGKRVWLAVGQPGELGYLDTDDREGTHEADRKIAFGTASELTGIQGIDLSKKGNLLLATQSAVWALDYEAWKQVRVAALPAGLHVEDLAYQGTTGAILVWGSFVREDHTVERTAAYRIARGSDKPEEVLLEGLPPWHSAAFDQAGNLYLGCGPDLWGGVLAPTEHERAADFAWQIRAFRIAPLGTPVAGEASDAGQIIHSIRPGGGRLVIAMCGAEGGSLLRLPAPLPVRKDGGVDRLIAMKDRWTFQQKVLASIQPLGAPDSLPRLPIVAVSADGDRIVYQTAAPGLRRWWVIEKSGKPRMMSEESD